MEINKNDATIVSAKGPMINAVEVWWTSLSKLKIEITEMKDEIKGSHNVIEEQRRLLMYENKCIQTKHSHQHFSLCTKKTQHLSLTESGISKGIVFLSGPPKPHVATTTRTPLVSPTASTSAESVSEVKKIYQYHVTPTATTDVEIRVV